jgi:nicotinate-nucleotide adenylyltransferase
VRLAIFGGSFDPVHIAHEAIVNEAIKKLDIDKLLVVPTYLNPFKNSFNYEPKIRAQLLKKVFFNNPKVEICDYEIKQNRSVYSIETINYLKNLYKPSKIYLIIGADNVKDLDKWHKINEIKSLVEFVVASRKGFITSDLAKFKSLKINIDISSTKLRDKIDLNFIPIQIKEDIINLQRNKKG